MSSVADSGRGDFSSDDSVLVSRVRRGDSSAFEELIRRYQRQATAVAFRTLNHRDDALEVVQDAFLRAYDRLDSLSEDGKFGGWLLRIVNNTALNRRRRRALRKHASLDAADEDQNSLAERQVDSRAQSPLEQALGNDLKKRLREAIDELPENQRQALVLFSIEKIPQKQVADILECSVEAVKWNVFTARKKLKEKLRDTLEIK